LEQEGHRERLHLSADMARDAARRGATSVCDLGAGDGGLLTLIPDVTRWGYDLQQTNVDAAVRRGVDVSLRDVVADGFELADCVVATEFLEHVVNPHALVRKIADSGAKFLVASSPYMETAESHYAFHLWAWDLAGYRAMMEDNGWRVLRQETSWICQVLLCELA